VDLACVSLLALAVLLPGVLIVTGLPGGIEAIIDLAAVGIGLGLVTIIIRDRIPVAVPLVVTVYLGLIVIGAVNADELDRMVVAVRNFLLLPTLALLLAMVGSTETRNRLVLQATLGLVAFEFLLTIVQALTIDNVDLIVGTFGDFAGSSMAFAIEVGACIALALVATRIGHARIWVPFALVVCLAMIWASIRLGPIAVPAAILAVAVAVSWLSFKGHGDTATPWRMPTAIAGVALASAIVLFAGFAIFRPFDFALFVDSEKRGTYLEEANIPVAGGDPSRPDEVALPKSTTGVDQVPGRFQQYRVAARIAAEKPSTFVIGHGLGATTYAENLGIPEPEEEDFVVVGFSDAGTLLVELGWLGVAIVVLLAVILGLAAIREAGHAPPASWTRALLVAYPGILVAMVAAAFVGNPFRNIGSAALFWILTGLVLASILGRGPRDKAA
jgi:hypothetical protein